MEKRRPPAPALCFSIFFFMIGLLYLPLLYLMVGSILAKTAEGWEMTLQWYRDVFSDTALLEALGRSLVIGIGNAAISTVLGTTAALALHRTGFQFRRTLQSLSLISLIMPELVFALSLLSWFFLIGLRLSLLTVMIAHVSFTLSFVILTVSARLSTFDFSLDEAAEDLGATGLQVIQKITLPLLKPALGTAFIMGFLLSFDDFLITFFTSGVGSDTLPVKLYAAMRMGHSPKLNALSTLMILFSVVLIAMIVRSRGFRDLWRG